MPMNAFDPMGTFNDAQNMAYSQQQKYAQDRARKRAGQAMQAGNVQGATGELYGAGDLEGARGIEDQQGQQQDRQFRQTQQAATLQQQEAARKADFMKRAALALRDMPQEQRSQAFAERVGPALVQLGMKPQDVQGASAHLDDASLTTFAGEMDKHIQIINRGGGGYDLLDTNNGKITHGPEPTQKAPTGYMYGPDGNLVVDPGYVAGQGQISNVRAAGVAAHRAPPRGRSGGSAGKKKPWERDDF